MEFVTRFILHHKDIKHKLKIRYKTLLNDCCICLEHYMISAKIYICNHACDGGKNTLKWKNKNKTKQNKSGRVQMVQCC